MKILLLILVMVLIPLLILFCIYTLLPTSALYKRVCADIKKYNPVTWSILNNKLKHKDLSYILIYDNYPGQGLFNKIYIHGIENRLSLREKIFLCFVWEKELKIGKEIMELKQQSNIFKDIENPYSVIGYSETGDNIALKPTKDRAKFVHYSDETVEEL